MADRDITDYLQDIINHSKDAQDFTKGITFDDFQKDKKTTYAIIRSIEIVGEAVRKLPLDFKKKHSHIPWEDIAGMRDKLIHDYIGVDLEIVWKTATVDIPQLLKDIEELV